MKLALKLALLRGLALPVLIVVLVFHNLRTVGTLLKYSGLDIASHDEKNTASFTGKLDFALNTKAIANASDPSNESNNLTCIAWRATADCRPDGPRLNRNADGSLTAWLLPHLFKWVAAYAGAGVDRPCHVPVPPLQSGYCELYDTQTGTYHRVFQKSCRQGYPLRLAQYQPYFHCDMAASFLQYKHRALAFQTQQPLFPASTTTLNSNAPTRGIVLQIYPGVMASVYAIAKLLREVHHCFLPIELWINPTELQPSHPLLVQMTAWFQDIHIRYLPEALNSYMTKPHVIAYSQWDQVLFLDSDNFPVRDPTFLFKSPEFRAHGALFWKDHWKATHDEFWITQGSVLWELLGLLSSSSSHSSKTEMEMESGQLVIDRRRSAKALKVLLFLAQTSSQFLQPLALAHGDKDLFRLSWHMTRTSFHYMEQPPGFAGLEYGTFSLTRHRQVCGLTLMQPGLDGSLLFLHRTNSKLSDSGTTYKPIWEKGLMFQGDDPETQYAATFWHRLGTSTSCYFPKSAQHFESVDFRSPLNSNDDRRVNNTAKADVDETAATSWPDLSVVQLEHLILSFAKEAVEILKV